MYLIPVRTISLGNMKGPQLTPSLPGQCQTVLVQCRLGPSSASNSSVLKLTHCSPLWTLEYALNTCVNNALQKM